MVLSIRMNLDKGRDRMAAEQAARIVRLTETFDNGRVTLDDERKLEAILVALHFVSQPPKPLRPFRRRLFHFALKPGIPSSAIPFQQDQEDVAAVGEHVPVGVTPYPQHAHRHT